jgi:hypothetical protein
MTMPTYLRRSLLVALPAALIAALLAAPALAANPGTTFTFHNQAETFVDTLACTGIPYQVTTTSNGVEHSLLTTLPDGTPVAQFTFTEAVVTFTSAPVSGVGPTFTGTGAVSDTGMAFNPVYGPQGQIVSAARWVETSTTTVQGKGSDGSTLFDHITSHLNVNPLGNINQLLMDSCTK